MTTLAGKVALVTGASRGIGRAVALRLAREGATVAINFRSNQEAARSTLADMEAAGGSGIVVAGDVAVADDATRVVASTQEQLGGLDIVVNNAGISIDQLVMRLSEDDWDRTIDTDLKGAFLVTKAAMRPLLKQRSGRIINVSSVVGLSGNAGQAAYAAAKAGLIGFSKSVAREVASRGITVNVVAPGYIETEMTRNLSETIRQQLLTQIPLGRIGTSDDVAAMVAFLGGDEAAYVTGQTFVVDGGLVMA